MILQGVIRRRVGSSKDEVAVAMEKPYGTKAG